MHVFLSYPKSGRTWVRFMVNSYLCRLNGLSLPNVFDAEKVLKPRYPVEWTHLTGAMIMRRAYYEMGPLDVRAVRHLPWLLLVRNFYATLASAYHQACDRIQVFTGTPAEFVRSARYGVVKLVTFYNLWEELRSQLSCTYVFAYEDLLADTTAVFGQILSALNIDLRNDLLDEVVSEASLDNMKALSVLPAYAGTPLAPIDPDDPKTFKVRQGGQGSFRELFSDEDLRYIDQVVDALLIDRDAEYYRRCRGTPPIRREARGSATDTPASVPMVQAAS